MDVPLGPIPFTVGDSETPPADLMLSGASSNPVLALPSNVVFGGGGVDRTVTITPTAGMTGTAIITITVSDGELSAYDTFVLAVGDNSPPEFTSTPPEVATVGVLYTYAVVATDNDAGDVLTFSAPTKPAWLSLTETSSRTATLSGTPNSLGDLSIALEVR